METQALEAISVQIKELTQKAEKLGDEGNIDESLEVTKEVEQLEARRTQMLVLEPTLYS